MPYDVLILAAGVLELLGGEEVAPEGLVDDGEAEVLGCKGGGAAIAEQGGETVVEQRFVLEVVLRVLAGGMGGAYGALVVALHVVVVCLGQVADLDGVLEQRGVEVEVLAQVQLVGEVGAIRLAAAAPHELVPAVSAEVVEQLSQDGLMIERAGTLLHIFLMTIGVEVVVADDHVGIGGHGVLVERLEHLGMDPVVGVYVDEVVATRHVEPELTG